MQKRDEKISMIEDALNELADNNTDCQWKLIFLGKQ